MFLVEKRSFINAKFKCKITGVTKHYVSFVVKGEDILYDKGGHQVCFLNYHNEYEGSWPKDIFLQHGEPLFNGPVVQIKGREYEISKLKNLLS